MKLNWFGYYPQYDGYGRFSSRFVRAVQSLGVQCKPATITHYDMPDWMLEQEGVSWDNLTISCMPPYMLQKIPGRHWLFSMTEGSRIPESWVNQVNNSWVERVLVPCEHNRIAFERSGVLAPVSIIPGGTDPEEFSLERREVHRPYTFLALADRGFRKGWQEVFDAFYIAFGGKTSGEKAVRLIIKSRPNGNDTVELLKKTQDADKRILFETSDVLDMRVVYNRADCLALPSRSEGWGMPHREAASLGLPVITQRYSGMDDGCTERWSLVLEFGEVQPIPKGQSHTLGEWMVADIGELSEKMRWCYDNPLPATEFGRSASHWIAENQTWRHSAQKLIELVEREF